MEPVAAHKDQGFLPHGTALALLNGRMDLNPP
jgi:hypothetical protein